MLVNARRSPTAWIIHLMTLGFLVAGMLLLVIVAGMLWRGDVWAFIIYAENPYAHLAGGLACLGVAYFLWRGYRNDARAWGRLAGKCLLAVISLAMAAVAGELGIRFIMIQQQQAGSIERLREMRAMNELLVSDNPHPMAHIIDLSNNLNLIFELQPNLNTQFGHRTLRTNRHGMRSDVDHSIAKSPGTVRIVGLGDSGMFGWDVEQGEEYMAVLERRLNERQDGRRYEVLNFAVPGYNTQLEVESLVHNGLQFDPDIVILGWCINDFQLPFFLLERENFTRRDVSFLHMYLFKRKMIPELIAGRRVTSLRGFEADKVDESIRAGSGVEGARQALFRLKQLAQSNGFHVLVSGPLNEHILPLVREVDLPYLNTFEKVRAQDYPEEYEVHYMHPRPGGHAVIAETILRELVDRGYLGE